MIKKLFKIDLSLLTIAIILCSCGGSDPIENEGGDNGEEIVLTFEGKVASNGQGIENVVVTDGKNFTRTDANGKYSLPFSQTATHVYISSPAGYTVPIEKSVPQYYATLKEENDRKNINFDLTKMSVSDTKHHLIAIGDPQVRNTTELNLLRPIVKEMTDYIASQKMNPVHLMIAGDIVFDTHNMHTPCKELFTEVGQPVYYTIGNHDHVKTTTTADANDKVTDATFKEHYGPTYYSFNRGLVHYIVLDNIFYQGGSSPVYENRITQEQLEWVKKDLSYVPKTNAVVVMLHATTLTRKRAANGNSADLHALLRGYANVHILSGHTHYNYVIDNKSGIIEHNVGAVCGGWWEGPTCTDGTNLGYKVFEMNGTDIVWEYHDYKDPTAQFSVSIPENRDSRLPSAEELIINVWDWEDRWEVSYSEDGGNTFKGMMRYTEDNMVYDPIAFTHFGIKGDNAVPGRSFIGAVQTAHVFSCIPSAEVNEVTIKVKSRFKTYTKKVEL